MRLRLSLTTFLLALGGAALLVAGAANAFSISYWLDQTNTTVATDPDGNLPDGPLYLKVTFADNGDDIDVTVDILSPPFCSTPSCAGIEYDPAANFGLQSFYFNDSTGTLDASEIIAPSGWSAATPGGNGDGFGGFEASVTNTGMDRLNPLNFTISRADDSIFDYAEGDPFFAAHVAGFTDQNPLEPVYSPPGPPPGCVDLDPPNEDWSPQCNILTSAWFAGSVPEPSTALLLFGGLSGLAVWGRRRLH
jgi:hypothetical protein